MDFYQHNITVCCQNNFCSNIILCAHFINQLFYRSRLDDLVKMVDIYSTQTDKHKTFIFIIFARYNNIILTSKSSSLSYYRQSYAAIY